MEPQQAFALLSSEIAQARLELLDVGEVQNLYDALCAATCLPDGYSGKVWEWTLALLDQLDQAVDDRGILPENWLHTLVAHGLQYGLQD